MTHDEWQVWRTQRIREGQRSRRARMRRIDYQDVSDEASAIIDAERRPGIGGDVSGVLNRIVCEWAALRGNPED